MKKVLRQAVGIDVSKDTFDVALSVLHEGQTRKVLYTGKFSNDFYGIGRFFKTIEARKTSECDIWYVMEATGVYYEELAWFLSCEHQPVSVLLPNKVRQYARSLDTRSKTDKIDAKVIAQMALERELSQWNAPSEQLWILKMINRERVSLNKEIIRNSNRRHALEYGHVYNQQVYQDLLGRSDQRKQLFASQIEDINQHMRQLAKVDANLYQAIQRITTIPGVGFQTALTVIAETNAFANITNIRQLVCYCGLDVKLNESGSFKGRTTITKKGNSFIRSSLFMPALTAIKHNPALKSYYEQLFLRKKNKKMALVSVMRKLLVLIYTLYRSEKPYNPDYKASTLLDEMDWESVMPDDEHTISQNPELEAKGAGVVNMADQEYFEKDRSIDTSSAIKRKREHLTLPPSVDESQPTSWLKSSVLQTKDNAKSKFLQISLGS